MKKLLFIALALVIANCGVFAQSSKELAKERKELRKMAKSELNEKASKDARKEAKSLKKEGWKVSPGALPLEKQLDKSYIMQYQYDDNGYPKFMMGEAMSVGGSYDAARTQAYELARQNLATQAQSEVAALVENTVGNKQLSAEEAESVVQSIAASKSIIAQSLGRLITVVEVYRIKKNKNTEVLLRVAYNGEMAKEAVKNAIREDLEKKGEDLHKKLDEALSL